MNQNEHTQEARELMRRTHEELGSVVKITWSRGPVL